MKKENIEEKERTVFGLITTFGYLGGMFGWIPLQPAAVMLFIGFPVWLWLDERRWRKREKLVRVSKEAY